MVFDRAAFIIQHDCLPLHSVHSEAIPTYWPGLAANISVTCMMYVYTRVFKFNESQVHYDRLD